LALYSPNGTYIDYAFQSRRSVPELLKRHWGIWRKSNPDFVMEVERFDPPPNRLKEGETTSFSIRTINKGTFSNDLPSKKASGKYFIFRAVVDFRINREGLIETIDEWYT
jgi:hypothetical protein